MFFRITNNINHIIIFLIILCQNAIWPIWNTGDLISFVLVIYLFIINMRKIISKTNSNLFFLLSIVSFVFIVIPLFTGFNLSNVIYLMCFWLSFAMSDYDYERAFILVVKMYAGILIVSFIPWFIDSFLYQIFPAIGTIDLSAMKGGDGYIMRNHFFYVVHDSDSLNRFYSVFNEPGVVGTFSAFVLFGLRYNIRSKYFWFILIPTLFTYSLAFYVLALIGFLYFTIRKRSLSNFVVVTLLLLGVIILFSSNDAFQQRVIDRLYGKSMEDNMDTRLSYMASYLYDSILWTKDFFIGLGSNRMEQMFFIHGSSYKVFILQRGFLAVLALVLMYISFIRIRNYMNLDSYVLLFIFIISFMQRPSAFSSWQMLLFCCILTCLSHNKEYKKNAIYL